MEQVVMAPILVARRDDACILDHQDDGSLQSARTMDYAFRDYEALPG